MTRPASTNTDMQGLDAEGKRVFTSQNIKDDYGNLLRDPTLIRERWERWFDNLLNIKSPTLDPNAFDTLSCVNRMLDDVPSISDAERETRINRCIPRQFTPRYFSSQQHTIYQTHYLLLSVISRETHTDDRGMSQQVVR